MANKKLDPDKLRYIYEMLDQGLTFVTCACGWETRWGDTETTHRNYRIHKYTCTRMTHRG